MSNILGNECFIEIILKMSRELYKILNYECKISPHFKYILLDKDKFI